MHESKTVISIFGDSGVGKTALTKGLAEAMGEDRVCVIHADYYLQDKGEKSLADLSCDFALLESHLSQPIGTLCHYPEYDFVAFRRINLKSAWNKFWLRPLIIVEQMYPYAKADLFIHLDMPWEQAVERVLRRDPPHWAWRKLLAEKWKEMASVRDSDAVKRLSHRLILDANLPIKDNVAVAMRYIIEALKRSDVS